MKRTVSAIYFLLLVGCRPSFENKVTHQIISFQDEQGAGYTVDLYMPKNHKPEAAVILAYATMQEQTLWNQLAMRMAVQNYVVLSEPLPAGVQSASSAQPALQAAVSFLHRQFPACKIGVVGSDKTVRTCLQAGKVDTTIRAAVLLTPDRETNLLDSTCIISWKGRPILLLATEHDGLWSAGEAQQFYDRVPEPKKLVWLAGANRGADLLSSDQEPIIRRTAVLLFDRHLRGKN